MSQPDATSTARIARTRQEIVEGLEVVISSLRRIHDDSDGQSERRLMARALEHLTDAQAIARREHHT